MAGRRPPVVLLRRTADRWRSVNGLPIPIKPFSTGSESSKRQTSTGRGLRFIDSEALTGRVRLGDHTAASPIWEPPRRSRNGATGAYQLSSCTTRTDPATKTPRHEDAQRNQHAQGAHPSRDAPLAQPLPYPALVSSGAALIKPLLLMHQTRVGEWASVCTPMYYGCLENDPGRRLPEVAARKSMRHKS